MSPFDSILTKEVYEIPDCFKQHINIPYRYVDVYSGSVVIARLALGIMGKMCLLHGVAEKWSPSALKAFRTAYFSAVVSGLKELGVTEVVTVNSVDKKWVKFIKMLYFSEPETFLMSRMDI